MYYFEHIYSYHKQRLITDVRLRMPNFTFDQESLQVAVRCALDERQWLDNAPALAEESVGGILDFDDERDEQRILLGGDGSSNGSIPSGTQTIRSFSMYSPRGDDGSHHDEWTRQTEFDYGTSMSRLIAMGVAMQ